MHAILAHTFLSAALGNGSGDDQTSFGIVDRVGRVIPMS
jgi:hypothetical protein